MSKDYVCKTCGRREYFGPLKTIEHVYGDNLVDVFFGRCLFCGSRATFVGKKNIEEVVFPDFPIVNDIKKYEIGDIYVSYVPIYSFIEENKRIILENKKNDDIIIGFNGWEDYVLDKELAGSWYMTQNSPPILDVFVCQMKKMTFGTGKVIYSYFPSIAMNDMGMEYKIINGRGVDFFGKMRGMMLEQHREFYVGVKNGYRNNQNEA